MDAAMLGGMIGAILAAAGGGLLATGVVSDNELNQIAGAVAALIAAGWSVWSKYRAKKV